jgi:hypothetical protein
VSGDARWLAGGELDQAERSVREPGGSGRLAEQLAAPHAYLIGPQRDRAQPQAEIGGYAAAAGIAGTCQAPAGREAGDGDDLGLFGPDRPEPDDIRAAEDASVSAWANGEAEWPPNDPWVRRGLHNLMSRMAEEIGWRPDEMVQVRAGDLDNALLVAVSALYEVDRRIEPAQQHAHQAAPDQDGRGMHWLEPGQVCSTGVRAERSAERGDFEAG